MAKEYNNKPNTFIAWQNSSKTKTSQPDFTGIMTMDDGSEKKIAIWINKAKNGLQMLNGQISTWKKDSAPGDIPPGPIDPISNAAGQKAAKQDTARKIAEFENALNDALGDDMPEGIAF